MPFSSRIIDIQVQMSERAIELLVLPEDTSCYLLDIGCGSGLSGSVLEDQGHFWVGIDISSSMLGTVIQLNFFKCSQMLTLTFFRCSN